MFKQRRSDRIILTNEARVLRDLRIASKLSMRKAGELVGRSDSYIAHIETGRMNPPTDEKLDRLLNIYGGLKQKSFYERVRNWKYKITIHDEFIEIVKKLDDEKLKILMNLAKTL